MGMPNWNDFIGVNSGDLQNAFEALARFLFKEEYKLTDNLAYFKNNTGNETKTITNGNEVIGFQAKYYEHEINTKDLIDSMEKAKEANPDQTTYVVYTNMTFGNPPKGKKHTKKEEVMKTASALGMKIEWWFGDNILDAVAKNPLLYDLFFNPNSGIRNIHSHISRSNELYINQISDVLHINGQSYSFNRSNLCFNLNEHVKQGRSVLIYGESGSGKSALVRRLFEDMKKDENDLAFYIINASQLDTNIVNDIFNLQESYTIVDFCRFYNNCGTKVFVIDSAEKLLTNEKGLALTLLIDELRDNGWTILFTCRQNAQADLCEVLSNQHNMIMEMLEVPLITDDELTSFAQKFKTGLPSDLKLRERLLNLFFLSRYCELKPSNHPGLTLMSFRENIWNKKIRGGEYGAAGQDREQCLLDIVTYQIENNTYYVPKKGVNSNAAYALITDEVLVDNGLKGYSIKHDIYADWAWDYIVYADFDGKSDFDKIITKENFAIQYINAFKRWLLNGINEEHRAAIILCESVFNKDVAPIWRKSIFECIGSSKNYAKQWFDDNRTSLSADNYWLFNEFVDVLCVSCYSIESSIKHRGKEYVLRRATGSGWEVSVNFVWEHQKDYFQSNRHRVCTLLSDFAHYKNAPKDCCRCAGLLALSVFDSFAEPQKGPKACVSIPDGEDWAKLVCQYSCEIKDELKTVFKRVVENEWTSNLDPYSKLIAHVLLPNDTRFVDSGFYWFFKSEIIDLMNLFWKEQPAKWWEARCSSHRESYFWGLNEDFVDDMKYFPVSALQTPIYMMLMSEYKWRDENFTMIDYVINFINSRVDMYRERHPHKNDVNEVFVKLQDGREHNVYVSSELWCLYRGVCSTSCLIESIHMALEKYLLDVAKDNENKSRMDRVLWRILNKSHSCSLYSIVASVATAHPNVYYEQLLFVLQNVHFLVFDCHRYDREYNSRLTEITSSNYECFCKERGEANSLPHRKTYLLKLLTELQLKEEENEGAKTKCRISEIVDNLKAQLNGIKGAPLFQHSPEDIGFIEEQINKGKPTSTSTQCSDVQSTRKRKGTKQLKIVGDQMAKIRNLRNWVDNKKDVDMKEVAVTIKGLRKRLESGDKSHYPLLGDEGLLFSASVLFLLEFKGEIGGGEREKCKQYILKTLLSLETWSSSILSSYAGCIDMFPGLIASMPEITDKLQDSLIFFATKKWNFPNRPCDMIYKKVRESRLWEKNRNFMAATVEKFKHHIGLKDFALMSPEQAESLLCLLSSNNPMRDLGELCVKKMAELWPFVYTQKHRHEGLLLPTETLIADYILYAPENEIAHLLSFFKTLINEIGDSFLNDFSSLAAKHNLYDKFWLVWEELYDCIIKGSQIPDNSIINSYLLNPHYMDVLSLKNDFHIKNKDIAFFVKVAKDAGARPAVICSIVKVFNTIGRDYLIEIIPTIDDLSKHLTALEQNTKKSILTQLEEMMPRLFNEYNDQRKKDAKLNKHVGNILTSMRDNGSKIAADLLSRM